MKLLGDKMQYKMVFSDIDGTLIDSERQISQGTRQKIQELCSAGVPFILVSARMPSGIFPMQKELGIQMPIICYSGALILNEHGACLEDVSICREKAAMLHSYIKNEWNICCSIFSHNYWVVDDINNSWVAQEQRITSSVPTEGDILDILPPDGHIHKLLCMGEPAQIAGLNEALKEKYPELSVHRSKDTYLEIMDGEASKSGAIKYLCEDYNISIEATVSFGDNFNDVDMLRATGTSFAMGNAPEEVQGQAKFVTLDNDHEGVLVGLRQLNFAENRK